MCRSVYVFLLDLMRCNKKVLVDSRLALCQNEVSESLLKKIAERSKRPMFSNLIPSTVLQVNCLIVESTECVLLYSIAHWDSHLVYLMDILKHTSGDLVSMIRISFHTNISLAQYFCKRSRSWSRLKIFYLESG